MKKFAALLLTGTLLCSSLTGFAAWENESDIASLLSELKIMQGDEDGNLRLGDSITRAEFCKVVIAASSYRDSVASGSRVSPFRDVPASHWAAPYIQLAVKNGFCKGYLDASFRPDNTILYEEALTMLLQVLGYTQEDFGSSWPYGQIGMAKKIGLCDDVDRQAGDTLTRRDVLHLCYRLLTTPAKGEQEDYITKLRYQIVEDVVLIATAQEDSAVGSDKVLTSAGTYQIGGSFSPDAVGKKGDAIIKEGDRLVAFLPAEQEIRQHTIYQALGDDLVVMNHGSLETLDLDTNLTVYHKSQKTSLSSLLATLEPGDVLTTYRNKLGILDYGVLRTGEMKGPFTYTGSSWLESLGLSNPTITRNGASVTAGQLAQYDIVYYSHALNQVWAYSDRVTGIYENASPNQDMPTKITVSGKEYQLEGTDALKKLASGGNYSYGDTITLLLGKSGGVADVIVPSQTSGTVYGYLYAVGTKGQITAGTNESYVDYSVSVALPNGESYEYAAAKDYSSLKNELVQVTLSGGKATVSKQNGRANLSGVFDWDGKTLGGKKLSPNLKILDVSTLNSKEPGLYGSVFPRRLDGVTLSGGQVLYQVQNTAGEITELILNNVTGDLYSYGIVKKATNSSSSGMGVGGSYSYYIDGKLSNTSSQKEFSVYSGSPARFVFSREGMIDSMRSLERVGTADQVTQTTVTVGRKSYPLSDKVTVYQKDFNSNYTVLPLSDVISGSVRVSVYQDKAPASGGQVRILVVE